MNFFNLSKQLAFVYEGSRVSKLVETETRKMYYILLVNPLKILYKVSHVLFITLLTLYLRSKVLISQKQIVMDTKYISFSRTCIYQRADEINSKQSSILIIYYSIKWAKTKTDVTKTPSFSIDYDSVISVVYN